MAITLRSNSSPLATTKNSPLSHDEMDANFTSSVFLFGDQGISGSKTFASTDGTTTFNTSASFSGSVSFLDTTSFYSSASFNASASFNDSVFFNSASFFFYSASFEKPVVFNSTSSFNGPISASNVTITGTGSFNGSSSFYDITVSNSASFNGLTVFENSSSFNNTVTVNADSVFTGSLSIGFTSPATNTVGRIDAANDVVVFSTSDERLKTNIRLIDNPLAKVNAIRGIKFDWIEDPSLQELHGFSGPDVGVVAQEVESVLPDIVSDKFTGYKGVKYDRLVPLLIEAIKELHSKVQDLEDRLTGG